MRPASDLARGHGRSSQRGKYRRAVAEPPGNLLKTCRLAGIERLSDRDVVSGYLIFARERVARSIGAEELHLRPNPVFRLGDGAAMKMVFGERPIVLGDYHQAQLYRLHPDTKRNPCGYHP
jgi:hypothetical protein